MSSRVFGLYTWKNRAAIWEHYNLWAQLGVCVKDRGTVMEVVPSNHRLCENACDTRSEKNVGGIVKDVLSSSVCILRNPYTLTAFLLNYFPPLMRCAVGRGLVICYFM